MIDTDTLIFVNDGDGNTSLNPERFWYKMKKQLFH
jgi:hypothetical protein